MVAIAILLGVGFAAVGGAAETAAWLNPARVNIYMAAKGVALIGLSFSLAVVLMSSFWLWQFLPLAILLTGVVYVYAGYHRRAAHLDSGEAK